MRFSSSHHSLSGQMVKSRAAENYILYNSLLDGTGSSNYEIDLPNAGRSYIIGNVIQQSASTTNRHVVAYGMEGQKAGRSSELFVVNNTIVSNTAATAYFVSAAAWVTQPLVVLNNIFSGPGTVILPLNSLDAGNCRSGINFVNASTADYRLAPSSLCHGLAVEPGLGAGFNLKPEYEYQQPLSGRVRTVVSDAGAIDTK